MSACQETQKLRLNDLQLKDKITIEPVWERFLPPVFDHASRSFFRIPPAGVTPTLQAGSVALPVRQSRFNIENWCLLSQRHTRSRSCQTLSLFANFSDLLAPRSRPPPQPQYETSHTTRMAAIVDVSKCFFRPARRNKGLFLKW